MLLSTAIQTYGAAVLPAAELKKSQVLREDKVIIDGREFNEALYQGQTLDQMNLQAGDVIQIATAPPGGKLLLIGTTLSGLAGLILLVTRVW